ncbi:MAG: hypothetical protein GF315_02830 [candidate division Zixibacteria bacterium]|nr:hypothetical protein [candidate division Zixibacteria bacterium]
MNRISNRLPFNFNNPKINHIDDYEFCRSTKIYLNQKRAASNLDEIEIMKESGYADLNKFRKHRELWHKLARDVPRGYLEALEVDYKILRFTIELDQESFEEALELELYPKTFIIRYMAAIYQTKDFGRKITEEEAVELVREISVKNKLRCCINYPSFKTIWIEPDNTITTTYYKPSIKFTKKWVKFGETGEGIGEISVR